MGNEFEQNCPLCGKPAKYFGVDYGRRKTFHCKECSCFQISNPAEARLEQSIQNWRDQLSQKAKSAPEDSILVITMPSNEEKEKGIGLNAVYTQKSKLPT